MPLTSAITAHDKRWPSLFKQQAARLDPAFGSACHALHHVGSTAVEGLSAKPEIDVLAVVSRADQLHEWTKALRLLGYRRGGDLSAGHHFFKRDVDGVRTHKLHVCVSGHAIVLRMLRIRDHLRTHAEDRAAYQALKSRLERSNTIGIAEYLQGKTPFLDTLYQKIQIGP
ncbi:MAG: GrpB family protein [Pseudomonadota bacterium]